MSDILKSVHKTVKGLNKAGAIDKITMQEFEVLCSTIKRQKQTSDKADLERR
jgi:DNA-binding transcriptional regulator YiaG